MPSHSPYDDEPVDYVKKPYVELDVVSGEEETQYEATSTDVETDSCCELLSSKWDIIRNKKRTVVFAIIFLICGFVFLGLGIFEVTRKHIDVVRAVSFFVLSFLCGLPGGYATTIILLALKKGSGYSVEMVPSYD